MFTYKRIPLRCSCIECSLTCMYTDLSLITSSLRLYSGHTNLILFDYLFPAETFNNCFLARVQLPELNAGLVIFILQRALPMENL